jgi:ribosomal protein S18 acetylase RimI-like enzyme
VEVELRPVTPGDRDLLLAVYASTRADELAAVPWTDEDKDTFVRMQFEAQDRHYSAHFPDARHDVVVVDGRPAGRLWVDRRPDEIRILDLALLPEARGAGVGTRLLRDLIEEGERDGRVVRLHVEDGNPARRLYDRLGFTPAGRTGAHLMMEHRCATSQP